VYECIINPFTNPNPVHSHSYKIKIISRMSIGIMWLRKEAINEMLRNFSASKKLLVLQQRLCSVESQLVS
jgi:hypothetical protein